MTRFEFNASQAFASTAAPHFSDGMPAGFVFGAGGQAVAPDGTVLGGGSSSSSSSSSSPAAGPVGSSSSSAAGPEASASSSSASLSRNSPSTWVSAWTPETDGSMSAALSATPEPLRARSWTPRRSPAHTPFRTPSAQSPPVQSPPVQTPSAQTPSAQMPLRMPPLSLGGNAVLPSIETPRSRMSTPSTTASPSPSFTISPPPLSPSPGARALARFPIRRSNDMSPGLGSVARGLAGVALNSPVASPGPLPRVIHRVEDEELSPHRVHAPEVQAALTNTRALARRLADVLGSGRLHLDQETDMYRLKKEAEELAQFEIAATRTVGLVGDSGVGKSSLINSLLDHESLARTSNAGGACTCVATEYIYHDRDDFVIDVELFTREEVKTQMTDLLLAYRQNYSNEQVEGRDELAKKAALADSTFKTIFNERVSREFLCAGESEQVLAQLHQWTDEAFPAELGGRRASFASARACSDELEKVSAGDKEGQWPFIRRVRVFLKSHVLRNGLKLVDLPGLRDVNVARIAMTERELQKCDEVFAVARIGRAKTDEGIVSVFDLARRVHLTNVGIICTASDEEEAHEAEKDRAGHERTEMRRLRERADGLKQQKRQAKEELKQLEEGDEAHQMLYRQYRSLKDQHKEADGALKKYMIETRNTAVTRSLEETFRDRANGDLRIFCVSSKIYREHRQDPLPQPGRLNWLTLSGIIALRRHCLGLTADRQLQALTTYVGSAMPGLLSNLGLWVAAGEDGGEGRAAVREALDEVEKRFREALRAGDSPLVWVHATISDSFADKIYQDQDGKIDAWSRAAIEACRDWRTVHQSTFAAFCRKRGVHKPSCKKREHNWNQEAIQAAADEVDLAWDDWIRGMRRDILHHLAKRLQVAGNLRVTPLVPLLEGTARLKDLATATSARQQKAEHEMKQLWGEFAQDLRELHNHAFTGIASSMMAAALERTYIDCLSQGCDRQRKQIMKEAVDDPELFRNLMEYVQAEVRGLAVELQKDMNAVGEDLLVGIGETLNLVRGENAAAEGDMDSGFRRRVAEAVEGGRVEMARLVAVVQQDDA